jgi:hypothetical protein
MLMVVDVLGALFTLGAMVVWILTDSGRLPHHQHAGPVRKS